MADEEQLQPTPIEVYLLNETVQLILSAMNQTTSHPYPLTVDDELQLRINSYTRPFGLDSDGNPIQILFEDDGTAKASLYGTDEAGNLDALLTDGHQQLSVQPAPAYISIDPALIPAADTLMWTPPNVAAGDIYKVSFLVVNVDGVNDVTVDVGIDVNAGGALAAAEYCMYQEVIPAAGSSGWGEPFIMNGGDRLRAQAGVVNDATLHIRAEQIRWA